MYLQYLKAVISKALQPARGMVELVQLIAALSAPTLAKFLGITMPTGDNALAYIGAAALAFISLRLFFVAPYQVWREQTGLIGTLKLELCEPERAELAHMSAIRAKKRLELAATLREYHWASFYATDNQTKLYLKAQKLMGEAGTPIDFTTGFTHLADDCLVISNATKAGRDRPQQNVDASFMKLDLLTRFLHGRITVEQMSSQLPALPNEPELPLKQSIA